MLLCATLVAEVQGTVENLAGNRRRDFGFDGPVSGGERVAKGPGAAAVIRELLVGSRPSSRRRLRPPPKHLSLQLVAGVMELEVEARAQRGCCARIHQC